MEEGELVGARGVDDLVGPLKLGVAPPPVEAVGNTGVGVEKEGCEAEEVGVLPGVAVSPRSAELGVESPH